MAFYDEKKIIEDADAYAVARFLGMKIEKRGKYNFIECPGHMKYVGHYDKKATNCWLTKKGCNCKACGHWYNLKEMVLCYKEYVEGTPVSYAEMLEIIAESCGDKDEYILNDDSNFQKADYNKKKVELSDEDYNILGLAKYPDSNSFIVPTECFTRKPEGNYEINAIYKNGNWEYSYYTTKKIEGTSLARLLNEDEDVYNDLIIRKAEAAMDTCKKVLDMILEDEKDDDFQKELYNTVLKKYIRAGEIFKSYSGKEKVITTYKLDDFQWL